MRVSKAWPTCVVLVASVGFLLLLQCRLSQGKEISCKEGCYNVSDNQCGMCPGVTVLPSLPFYKISDCSANNYDKFCRVYSWCGSGTVTACNGAGTCRTKTGVCSCNRGFAGNACQYSDAVACNGHGTVNVNGICSCASGYQSSNGSSQCDSCAVNFVATYPTGSLVCSPCNASTCSGHGSCASGVCACQLGYAGSACDLCAVPNYYGYPTCTFCDPNNTCNGHGSCLQTGLCQCNDGYTGTNCQYCAAGRFGPDCRSCPLGTNGLVCSGISGATCSDGLSGTGVCTCPSGRAGDACQYSDAVTCSSHGTALSNGACSCQAGFAGAACDKCAANYYVYPQCNVMCSSARATSNGVCNVLSGAVLCVGGYSKCAAESGSCTCSGQALFVSDSSKVGVPMSTAASGSFPCTKASFGGTDPDPGNPKSCWCLPSSSTAALKPHDTSCGIGTATACCSQCENSSSYNPPTCKYCMASSTCNSRGTCNNFGDCVCSSPFTGPTCDECLPGYFGASCSACPGGAATPCNGLGQCSDGKSGTGICTCNTGYSGSDCLNAIISSVVGEDNVSIVASNGYRLNIYGQGFETYSASTHKVYMTTDSTDVQQTVLSWLNTQIVIQLVITSVPAGGSFQLYVDRNGSKSSKYNMQFSNPVVSSISPVQGSIWGGSDVTITGRGFGNNPASKSAMVGVQNIIITSWTDTKVVGTTNAGGSGSGLNANVSVTMCGLSSAAKSLYSFYAPVLTGVIPSGQSLSTAGGTITICGQQLGDDSALIAGTSTRVFPPLSVTLVNPSVSTSPVLATAGNVVAKKANLPAACSASSDSWATLDLPAGKRAITALRVALNDQISSSTFPYQYAKPTISGVTGCSGLCPSAGGITITIDGTNFGTDIGHYNGYSSSNDLTVSVGGTACTGLTMVTAHTKLTCVLPSGIGKNVAVLVTRAGVPESSAMDTSLSYTGPEIVAKSLVETSADATSDSASQVDGASGNWYATSNSNILNTKRIKFSANYFGTSASEIVVFLGTHSSPNLFPCTNIIAAATWISCVPNAVGGGKGLLITAGKGTTSTSFEYAPPSTDFFNYLAPTITAGSLRIASRPADTPPLTSNSNSGDLVYMDGTNFSINTLMHVFLVKGGLSPVLCNIKDVTTTRLTVVTPAGVDASMTFQVNMGPGSSLSHQFIVTGSDQYSYAVSPVITKISGCPKDTATAAVGCPSDAVDPLSKNPVLLTLTGTYFGGSSVASWIMLGGTNASCLPGTNADTERICKLLPGVGLEQSVIYFRENFQSSSVNLLSYMPPSLTSIQSTACKNDTTATSIISCPRAGNVVITLTGSNFGPSGATVFVGNSQCQPVVHLPSSPYTSVTCTIGSGASLDNKVWLIALGGSISDIFGSLSYEQCPSGYYYTVNAASVACIPCAPGSYSKINTGDASAFICPICEKGQFSPSGAQTACSSCPVGKFAQSGGLSTCGTCPKGEYSEMPGSAGCSKCPVGTYNPSEGNYYCVSCGIGKYADTAGSSACVDCAPGTTTTGPGQAVCSQCASGKSAASAGSLWCTDCSVGTVTSLFGQGTCAACQKGTYMNTGGQQLCLACEPGKYTSANGLSACSNCAPGTYARAGASACTNCSAGFFAINYASSTCFKCGTGKFTNSSASSTCGACAIGTHSSLTGQTACAQCNAGSYNSNEGSSSCLLCPAGRFSECNVGNCGCTKCAVGKFARYEGSSVCLDCDVSSSNPLEGQPACILCELGQYADVQGLSNCKMCPYGKYQNAGGASTCGSCPIGKYTDVTTGLLSCVSCPSGTFAGSASQSSCTSCPVGKHQPADQASACIDCAAGYSTSLTGSVQCTICRTGRYSASAGQDDCSQCPEGTFASGYGLTACAQCSPGTYSAIKSQSGCSACSPGSFSAVTGVTVCSLCTVGTFNSLSSQSSCTLCPLGTYSSTDASRACFPCQPGRFANSTGQSSCVSCDKGYFTSQTGAQSCQACQTGTYSERMMQTNCFACTSGKYGPVEASTVCLNCDAGYYQNLEMQTACLSCPVGKHSWANTTVKQTCYDCAPGTIAAVNASSLCTPCAKGWYVREEAATRCNQCLKGSYSAMEGALGCMMCNNGTYAAADGASACVDCPQGRFQDSSYQATTCRICPVGKYQDKSKQQECLTCPPGSFNTAPESTACSACAQGKYQFVSMQTACIDCELGKFAAQTGATACRDCTNGTYSTVVMATACLRCSAGQYQDLPAATYCKDCPPGRITATSGQGVCSFCGGGFYSTLPRSTACSSCEVGKYRGEIDGGGQFCLPCPAGTYSRSVAQSACVPCPSGEYSNDATIPAASRALGLGNQNCTKCKEGTYASVGQSVCQQCNSGNFADQQGLSQCYSCNPGRYAVNMGSTTCSSCAAGWYQDRTASTGCSKCSEGYYSAMGGAITCSKCRIGSASPRQGMSTCFNCEATSLSDALQQKCDCNPGYYMTAAVLWETDLATGTYYKCNKCPLGAVCTNRGTTMENMETKPGFYRTNGSLTYGSNADAAKMAEVGYLQCISVDNCPGGAAGGINKCGDHRTGELCGICEEGYKANTATSPCEACPDKQTSLIVMSIFIVVFIATLFLMYYVVLRADRGLLHQIKLKQKRKLNWENDADVDFFTGVPENVSAPSITHQSRHRPNMMYKMKIFLGFLQVSTNLVFVIHFQWPHLYEQFLDYFSFVNLDFIPWQSAGCATNLNFYLKLTAVTLIPFAVFVAILLFFVVPTWCMDMRDYSDNEEYRARRLRSWYKFIKIVLFTVFLLYPGVSSTIFSYFVSLNVNGKELLLADLSLPYGDAQWQYYFPFVMAMLAIYPIGVPVAFAWVLNRKRDTFVEPDTRLSYGFLYESFNHDCWFWEICDMGEKLVLTSLLYFVPKNFQLEAAMLFVTGYIISLLLYYPHVRKGDDRLALLAQVEIFMTVFLGYLISTVGESLDESVDVALSILLFAMTFGFFVVFLAIAGKNLKKLCNSYLRNAAWKEEMAKQKELEEMDDEGGDWFGDGDLVNDDENRTSLHSSMRKRDSVLQAGEVDVYANQKSTWKSHLNFDNPTQTATGSSMKNLHALDRGDKMGASVDLRKGGGASGPKKHTFVNDVILDNINPAYNLTMEDEMRLTAEEQKKVQQATKLKQADLTKQLEKEKDADSVRFSRQQLGDTMALRRTSVRTMNRLKALADDGDDDQGNGTSEGDNRASFAVYDDAGERYEFERNPYAGIFAEGAAGGPKSTSSSAAASSDAFQGHNDIDDDENGGYLDD